MTKSGLYLVLLIVSSLTFQGIAQIDTSITIQQKTLIIKYDGVRYTGYVLSDDAREILLESDQVGKIYIPKLFIKSIDPYESEKKKETPKVESVEEKEPQDSISFSKEPLPNEEKIEIEKVDSNLFQNFVNTKYIYSDNAFPLRKGESFVKLMPLGLEAQLPLTKNWSIGAVSTYWGMPIALKTKFSFEMDLKNHLSLDLGYGTMAFGSRADRGIRDGGGTISATYTYGDRSKNFSVKAGYALAHEYSDFWLFDETAGQLIPGVDQMYYYHIGYINFGGMLQLTDRTTFVMDGVGAYVNNGFFASLGAAIRFGRNPRHKWQLGGSIVLIEDFISPFPFPNLSYTHVLSQRNR